MPAVQNHHRSVPCIEVGPDPTGTPYPTDQAGASAAGIDWGDETGAQTAEYGIVTLAAVGFAGVLAVVLAGTDVKGLLLGIVQNALSFG